MRLQLPGLSQNGGGAAHKGLDLPEYRQQRLFVATFGLWHPSPFAT